MSPPYLPMCDISMSFKVNLYVPTLIFKMYFFFVCPYRSWSGRGWPIFSMLGMLLSRWVFIHLSLPKSVSANRDAQSRNEKEIYFMLSNNKFLGKCWYGRHPWIQLAMDCERMVEKGISFILCLGTAYDVSTMESIENSLSFSLTGKVCLTKFFIS